MEDITEYILVLQVHKSKKREGKKTLAELT